ncbi:hypothetical protein B0H14DRAFT_1241405 [Mycena olivaceomarginata]|nr:hypothetical protein B0H14DRAFT_1241405 [Mycena olivaceomarginata]
MSSDDGFAKLLSRVVAPDAGSGRWTFKCSFKFTRNRVCLLQPQTQIYTVRSETVEILTAPAAEGGGVMPWVWPCKANHNAGVCAVTSESGLNVADSESMDCGQLECVRVRGGDKGGAARVGRKRPRQRFSFWRLAGWFFGSMGIATKRFEAEVVKLWLCLEVGQWDVARDSVLAEGWFLAGSGYIQLTDWPDCDAQLQD